MIKGLIMFLGAVALISCLQAQEANYDETLVPDYVLPELLINKDGSQVKKG